LTDTNERRLGTIEGKAFFLVWRASPDINEPLDFSVSLYCERESEVVRIDNSHGKGPHIHRLYRRDEAEESFDGGLWEAVDTIQRNWRTYAQSYLKNP